MRFVLQWLSLQLFALGIYAQEVRFTAKVLDETTKQPIQYVSIEAWSIDSVFLGGAVTNKEGEFGLSVKADKRPFLKISFLGYQSFVFTPSLNEGQKKIQLSDIFLRASFGSLNEVVVQGQRKNYNVLIDKQVITAKQFQIAQNGTGIDVLQKISSVTVTNEGEIALRGSVGFIVFINGKRSNRAPADVLAQLPANSIESVELITSPSAKYDADGKTGIINIVTKKAVDEGWSINGNGMFAGTDPLRYGADLMLTYGAKKWNVYAGGDYRRYDFNGRRTGIVRTLYQDTLTYMPSDGARDFMEYQYSFRSGVSFVPNAANHFNISVYAGKKRSDRTANLHYDAFYEKGKTNLFENSFSSALIKFYNHNLFSRIGEFKTIDFDYAHVFTNKSKLTLLGMYEHSVLGGPLNNQDYYEGMNTPFQDENSTEKSPLNGLRLQADYTIALNSKLSLTAGYQLRQLKEDGYFFYERLDTTTNGIYFKDQSFNDSIHLEQTIQAGYVQLDGKHKELSYSFGLRAEYLNRSLQGKIDPTNYSYNKVNWFPSVQALWNLKAQQKLRLGYSRRIEWANVKMLSPFKNHRHEETIEVGFPSLQPEISDIIELSYSKSWKRFDFAATTYYNKIKDKVFRVNEIYSRTILLRGYTNAGNTTSVGFELASNIKLAEWWGIALSTNIYNYQINGTFKNVSINQQSINYNGNATTTIDFTKRFKFQWGFTYTSNTVTSQGHDTKLFLSTAGGRYSIFNKKGYIGLQINNIFNTNNQTIITQAPDFYSSTQYIKYDRALQLSIGWQLNSNAKKAKASKTDYGEKEF